MRGHVDGLASPHELGPSLPALYLEDSFAQRLTSAFDEVLAPVHASLDNLDAYVDPWLAPDDFVDWLSEWVGAVVDQTWDSERRRASVAYASELYRVRGTSRGLAAQVELVTGGSVEIVENGATSWTLDPTEGLPGTPDQRLVVRVTVPDPKALDMGRLDRLVLAAKPAHIPHTIEVLPAGGSAASPSRDGKGPRRSKDPEGEPPTEPVPAG